MATASGESEDGGSSSGRRAPKRQPPPSPPLPALRPRRRPRSTQGTAEAAAARESAVVGPAEDGTESCVGAAGGPAGTAVRTRACLPCKRSKTACSGAWPCDRCYRHCFECRLPPDTEEPQSEAASGRRRGTKRRSRNSSSEGEGDASEDGDDASEVGSSSGGGSDGAKVAGEGGQEGGDDAVVVDRALAFKDPAAIARDYRAAFLAVHAAHPVDRQAAVGTLRVWWLQSALVGHDVSKGVGADLCRLLGIGLHEVEDPEARRLDLSPHVRRARLAARASQLQAACADLHASPGFRLEDDGATAMYVCRVEPGGKMVFASNAAHDAMFRKAREVMEDCEARRMPPAWVFSAVVCPEDRQEWFKATIQMMFGRRGHGHHVATNAPHARVKPLTVSRFIKAIDRNGLINLFIFRGSRVPLPEGGFQVTVKVEPVPASRHVSARPEASVVMHQFRAPPSSCAARAPKPEPPPPPQQQQQQQQMRAAQGVVATLSTPPIACLPMAGVTMDAEAEQLLLNGTTVVAGAGATARGGCGSSAASVSSRSSGGSEPTAGATAIGSGASLAAGPGQGGVGVGVGMAVAGRLFPQADLSAAAFAFLVAPPPCPAIQNAAPPPAPAQRIGTGHGRTPNWWGRARYKQQQGAHAAVPTPTAAASASSSSRPVQPPQGDGGALGVGGQAQPWAAPLPQAEPWVFPWAGEEGKGDDSEAAEAAAAAAAAVPAAAVAAPVAAVAAPAVPAATVAGAGDELVGVGLTEEEVEEELRAWVAVLEETEPFGFAE